MVSPRRLFQSKECRLGAVGKDILDSTVLYALYKLQVNTTVTTFKPRSDRDRGSQRLTTQSKSNGYDTNPI